MHRNECFFTNIHILPRSTLFASFCCPRLPLFSKESNTRPCIAFVHCYGNTPNTHTHVHTYFNVMHGIFLMNYCTWFDKYANQPTSQLVSRQSNKCTTGTDVSIYFFVLFFVCVHILWVKVVNFIEEMMMTLRETCTCVLCAEPLFLC